MLLLIEKVKTFFRDKKMRRNTIITVFILAIITIAVQSYIEQLNEKKYEEQSITEFLTFIKTSEVEKVKDVHINEPSKLIKYEFGEKHYKVEYPAGGFLSVNEQILDRLALSKAEVKFEHATSLIITIVSITSFIFYLIIIGVLMMFVLPMFKMYFKEGAEEVKGEHITFKDIAGYAHVKEELKEVIDFLNHPEKYEKYTSKIVRGILMEGPPGNGKTLLAKAVAGETNTPFFQISGADVEDMYVGSGARKVKRMFETVRKKAEKKGRAILFIDEIDAFAISRESRTVVETNQTINKFLTEMDGFKKEDNIIVIAATNLASVLDPAVTRSGRFDRIIHIPKPHLKDRQQIIDLYLSKKKNILHPEIVEQTYAYTLAQQTEGFSSADLAKLINEASLLANKYKKEQLDIECLREAFTKIVAGVKNDQTLSEKERKIVAYHEAGHAIAQIILKPEGIKSVAYITITPRGSSLGHVSAVKESQVLHLKSDLENEIKVLFAGRAVEERVLDGDYTTGAASDIQQANHLIMSYITKLGMSDTAQNLFMEKIDENSDQVRQEATILRERLYNEVKTLVDDHFDKIELIANALLQKEAIDQHELYEILQIKKES